MMKARGAMNKHSSLKYVGISTHAFNSLLPHGVS